MARNIFREEKERGIAEDIARKKELASPEFKKFSPFGADKAPFGLGGLIPPTFYNPLTSSSVEGLEEPKEEKQAVQANIEPYIFGDNSANYAQSLYKRGLGEQGVGEPTTTEASGYSRVSAPNLGLSISTPGLDRTMKAIKENRMTELRQDEKVREGLVGDQGLLTRYSQVMQDKLLENNRNYDEWLQNNEKAKAGLQEIQAKYPVLTRNDAIANMSGGQLLVSSLLSLVPAMTGVPIEKNPAWNTFLASADAMVEKNKLNYERERNDLLQTRLFDNDTFKMKTMQLEQDSQMKQNILQNSINILQAKAKQLSPEEREKYIQNEGYKSIAELAIAKDNLNVQLQMQKNNMLMQERAYQLAQQTTDANLSSVLDWGDISSVDNKSGEFDVRFSPKTLTFPTQEAKAKAAVISSETNDKIKMLSQASYFLQQDDRAKANAWLDLFNNTYGSKLPMGEGTVGGMWNKMFHNKAFDPAMITAMKMQILKSGQDTIFGMARPPLQALGFSPALPPMTQPRGR